ncbi:MAG: PrsW family intramembrane metalloprotease [Fimbriimonadaceae bacterium]|nr:PrsW family intramembrane metalloprotease [Fimbriimonadaceae bacterium]
MPSAALVLVTILLGLAPMLLYAAAFLLFDRFEREPPALLIGAFLWGALVAAAVAWVVNTSCGVALFWVTGSAEAAQRGTAVLVAPLVEESVKGLALLLLAWLWRRELDSLLDGVLYGCLVGFGFAASENASYIWHGYTTDGVNGLVVTTFVRVILLAFLHAGLTALTGLGLARARLARGPADRLAPLLGFGAAVALHAAHNLLANLPVLAGLPLTLLDWSGFAALLAYLAWLAWREGWVMREQLAPEVAAGLLSAAEFRAVCSLGGHLAARAGWGRQRRQEVRFHHLCGELAFRKLHLATRGADREPHAATDIERLREQLRAARM